MNVRSIFITFIQCSKDGERLSLEIAGVLRSKRFRAIYVTNSAEAAKRVAELHGLPGDYEVIEVSSLLENY